MRARKKDLREMEDARRASLADEEACRIRAVESAAAVSSSRDVDTVGDTSEGVQTT